MKARGEDWRPPPPRALTKARPRGPRKVRVWSSRQVKEHAILMEVIPYAKISEPTFRKLRMHAITICPRADSYKKPSVDIFERFRARLLLLVFYTCICLQQDNMPVIFPCVMQCLRPPSCGVLQHVFSCDSQAIRDHTHRESGLSIIGYAKRIHQPICKSITDPTLSEHWHQLPDSELADRENVKPTEICSRTSLLSTSMPCLHRA